VFVIGYLAALTRFLCAGAEGQEAMERLVGVTANAVVTVLTLTVATAPASRAPPGPPAPRPRGTETARNPGERWPGQRREAVRADAGGAVLPGPCPARASDDGAGNGLDAPQTLESSRPEIPDAASGSQPAAPGGDAASRAMP
jgi:hypothetical protein